MPPKDASRAWEDGLFAEVVDTESLEWLDFDLVGASYVKPLDFTPQAPRSTFLLRMDTASEGPLHRHHGTVEYYVLEGCAEFPVDTYLLETGGFTHREAPMDRRTVLYSVNHGPVQAYDDDRNPYPPMGDERMAKLMASAYGRGPYARKDT